MRTNLSAFRDYQVFLNYPFDHQFKELELALHFPIIAAGLLPVCAKDLSVPDRPRLDVLVEAIRNSQYSVHEFSRSTGEGVANLARMNMPIEMGMALFHALESQRAQHRCAFFVPTAHDYKQFASDLAGLDPKCHDNNAEYLLAAVYEWLRAVVPTALFNSVPTVEIVEKYHVFRESLIRVRGTGDNGAASHDETRELMYQLCAKWGWWDWRESKAGRNEFPSIPIAWQEAT